MKPKSPKCADCGTSRHPFPYSDDGRIYVWLCGPCKFTRDHPAAQPPALMLWEKPPAPLQRERLF